MDPLSLFLTPWALKVILGVVAVGALVSFLALPRTFLMSRCCMANYRRWMQRNGLTEVTREDRLLFKGPYFGEPGSGHVVFRAEYRDVSGAVKKAFCRCGDHARGILGHHDLDVRWDD
ncbi:MAG TPA: hypothetical protein VMU54_02480 [Planctomycetota bacterium]|nr:hypothetical protein [Planctomycetota bacterium]